MHDRVRESIIFAPERWPGSQTRVTAADGVHILLREDTVTHRLWVEGAPEPGVPLVAEILLDRTAELRIPATLRFWRHIGMGQPGATPLLPPHQRQQLIRKLRALDGRLSGASYRAITEAFHGPLDLKGDDWKTAPVRQATIRLVREGLILMKSGYRKLLASRGRR